MKNIILSLFIVLSISAYSQAPQGVNYQAVIRDNAGLVLANSPVGLKMSLRQNSPTGTIVYEETFSPTTTSLGLVNVVVGQGAVTTGVFATIDWSTGTYYLEVSADPTGGSSYTSLGTQKLMSVPYALYAETSGGGSVGPQGIPGTNGVDGVDGTNGTDGIDGVDGTDGVDGAAGTTGQSSNDVYSSGQVLVLAANTTYTVIPGMSQTINIPANAVVIVSTSGGVQCTIAGTAFAAVDIGIHVDGVASPQAGQQEIVASNTPAVAQMLAYWSMTKTYNLAAGNHTFDVRVKDAGGTADANVAGTNPLIQAVLTVTVIKL